MNDRLEAFFALAERYPEIATVLVTAVIWPTITGLVSFAQDSIKARAPRVWSVLKSSGFDALGTIRKVWPKRLPPPPPAAGDEPSAPAPTTPTGNTSVYRVAVVYEKPATPKMPPPPMTVLCALAIALTGCGADPKLAAFADKIATVNDIALSCEAGRYEAEQHACLDKPNPEACIALVRQREQAAKEAFDGLHATACGLSPNAEGCQ
jgi:hypothetical protein